MAEYYISYEELEKLFDKYVAEIPDNNQLCEHKAEILAAITGDYEQGNWDSTKEMIALWENHIKVPSRLVLGSRYIRVQQTMLDFLKISLTTGLIDALIGYASQGSLAGLTFSVCASITVGLWELFTTVKKLDDNDFCVYMQATTHFREHKDFSLEELTGWLPRAEHSACNMLNGTWDCDYLDDAGNCSIIQKKGVEQALNSLQDKGLLMRKEEKYMHIFRFKR